MKAAPDREATPKEITEAIMGLTVLPFRKTSATKGEMVVNTYRNRLLGISAGAITYACVVCLDNDDWFPTIKRIKTVAKVFMTSDQAALTRIHALLRCKVEVPDEDRPSAEEVSKILRGALPVGREGS